MSVPLNAENANKLMKQTNLYCFLLYSKRKLEDKTDKITWAPSHDAGQPTHVCLERQALFGHIFVCKDTFSLCNRMPNERLFGQKNNPVIFLDMNNFGEKGIFTAL